jgi:putative selenium metabolism hydrolase
MKNNELIELAQALLRIPSKTGEERKIAEFACDYMEDAGFECEINKYNSVFGIVRFGKGPTILLDAHIDTVDAGSAKWKHNPYSGEIDNGRIYGRGASDMKGSFAAMLQAAKELSKQRELNGNIIITGTSWEEYFEGFTLGKIIEDLNGIGLKPDYAIIGEASELNIKRGQRGRTRVFCDIKGKPSHSAHPEEGINAVYKATALIKKIRETELPADDFLGKKIIELIGVQSSPFPVDSVVPYNCRIGYDLRILQGDTKDTVLRQFKDIVNEIKNEDKDFDADISIASGEVFDNEGQKEIVEAFPPAWEIPEDHMFVKNSKKALNSIGLNPEITKYDFCTNGSYTAGEASIPTIGFGPGKESSAHIVDEYIEIKELEKACAGYIAILESMLK